MSHDFACRNAEEALGNLLAVIHRDGGHYLSDHGIEKATRDAADIVVACRTEIERLREHLKIVARYKAFRNPMTLVDEVLASLSGEQKTSQKHSENIEKTF
jgi:hypothetical protein